MPRAKYTKPPGPLPAFEQIPRSKFHFRNDQWRKLTEMLPCRLASLGVPSDAPEKVKTIADWVVQATEHEIVAHLTAQPIISQASTNPANVRAAIRRLREALKPFVRGWVDNETADIIPADLDAKLAARDQEIAELRLASAQRRLLAMLCQRIEVWVRQFASANGETVSKQQMLRYIDATLNFARIEHPDFAKHRERLAKLVFPSEPLPH